MFSILTKMPIKPADNVFCYVLCAHTTHYLLQPTEHSIHTLIRSRLKTYPVQVRRLSYALCKVDMYLL